MELTGFFFSFACDFFFITGKKNSGENSYSWKILRPKRYAPIFTAIAFCYKILHALLPELINQYLACKDHVMYILSGVMQ